MKKVLMLSMIFAFVQIASAVQTVNYGWEGTETILGMYPENGVIAQIATDPVHGGSQSLYLERVAESTPQAFVAWIVGLSDGDEVTGSFWRYDVTPGVPPSCRIWAHWNDDPDDVYGHNGSASGNGEYGTGEGWDETSYTWTVVEGHTGLVIEARVYSNPGDIIWVDDMTIIAPDGATIYVPGTVSLESGTWADIKAAF
ncbi:MAG: hypothetical protein K8R76_11795 [Candidatus Aegiribacteria sp.]|nr:hypothetical protein [Candidatus Aegiribacteria sp.]